MAALADHRDHYNERHSDAAAAVVLYGTESDSLIGYLKQTEMEAGHSRTHQLVH